MSDDIFDEAPKPAVLDAAPPAPKPAPAPAPTKRDLFLAKLNAHFPATAQGGYDSHQPFRKFFLEIIDLL